MNSKASDESAHPLGAVAQGPASKIKINEVQEQMNTPEKQLGGGQVVAAKPPLLKAGAASTSTIAQVQQAKEVPQLQVEKIIGMSQSGCSGNSYAVDGAFSSATSIAVSPRNGDIAYIAGAFVVVYGMKSSRQEKFLKSAKSRAFQCLAFSPDGAFLAAGASCMRQPDISIWSITESDKGKSVYKLIHSLSGHRFGIQSLCFSPSSEFLISIGDQSDKGVFVWDTRAGVDLVPQPQDSGTGRSAGTFSIISSNQVGSCINSFAFHPEEKYMVTVGYSHLKLWDFKELLKARQDKKQTLNGSKEAAMVLQAKSVDLSKVRQRIFVGVACHNSLVYALTSGGHLNIFNEEGKLSKWMDIQVSRAFGCTIDAAKELLYCACADGIIRMFNAKSLEHITTNQKPPPLGQTNIETGVKKIKVEKNQKSKYADVLAVICDEQRSRFLAVYSDNMVFLWDYQDLKKIQVVRTFLSHNGTIHDIQVVNERFDVGLTETEEGRRLQKEGSLTRFVTCAADRTLRFWHFVDTQSIGSQSKSQIQKGLFRNAYCKDMSKIIFVKNADELAKHNFDVFKAKPIDKAEDGTPIQDNEEIAIRKAQDVEQAIRCLRLSHDGKFIACGDWHGNIRIHDLNDPALEETKCIEAHESEVLSIDFSRQISAKSVLQEPPADADVGYLLASGSRDQLVQIYDSTTDYGEIQIIEAHQAAVTAVRFVEERTHKPQKGSSGRPIELQVSLLSGGADQQMLKHSLSMDQDVTDFDPFELTARETFTNKIFSLDVARKASEYLDGAPAYAGDRSQAALGRPNGQFAGNPCIIVGHDRILSLRGTQKLQRIWEKVPDPRRKVVPDYLKVVTDDSGQVVAASGTDKQLSILEAESGRLLCKALCGELTTGMCFSQNGRHLITTSSIGVIYIWKLPENVTKLLNKPHTSASGIRAPGLLLDRIDEDENEDTLKRQSQPLKQEQSVSTAKNSSGPSRPMPFEQKQKDVKTDLDSVFAQIKQVENQIEGASLAAKGGPTQALDSAPQQQEPLAASCSKNSSGAKADVSGQSSEPATPLNFGAQKDTLPRWAQSIAGSDAAAEASKRSAVDVSTASMQNLFEQNLQDIGREGLRREASALQAPQKVDILEGEDDDDLQLMANEDDGSEVEQRIANIRSSQFEQVYGLGGNESNISSDLRRSRDWFSKKSGGKARQSIAGKFRMRKDTESHATASALGKSAADITTSDINQQVPNKVQTEKVGQEQPLKRKDLPAEITNLLEDSSPDVTKEVKSKEKLKSENNFNSDNQALIKPEVSVEFKQKNTNYLQSKKVNNTQQNQEQKVQIQKQAKEQPKALPNLEQTYLTQGSNASNVALNLDDIDLTLDAGPSQSPVVNKGPSQANTTAPPIDKSLSSVAQNQSQITSTSQTMKNIKNDQVVNKESINKVQVNLNSQVSGDQSQIISNSSVVSKDKQINVVQEEPSQDIPKKLGGDTKTKATWIKKDQKEDKKVTNLVLDQDVKVVNPDSLINQKPQQANPQIISPIISNVDEKSIFQKQLPSAGAQSAAPNQAVLSSHKNLAIKKPLLPVPSDADGSHSMILSPAISSNTNTSQLQIPSYSSMSKSDQRSRISVPLPAESESSTQTLSAEANNMVNFQLQFEIQRINDSLKNINQILNRSQSLSQSQSMSINNSNNMLAQTNMQSVQSLPSAQYSDKSSASKSNLPLQQSQTTNQILGGLTNPFNRAGNNPELPLVSLDNHVSGQLSQSLALWNGMMQQMQSLTSINVEEVQRQSLNFQEQSNDQSFGRDSQNNISITFEQIGDQQNDQRKPSVKSQKVDHNKSNSDMKKK